ncbi:LuxR C-terminal-related transcriptional regulator [Paraburkholderia sp. SIMBA_054]|uniref:LuxR C-terminal-related transcriptional regulator n=1 Tax=Paraburkholderia sp. SIMBA_054 TaxID=3085795 RepID=UPI00397A7232
MDIAILTPIRLFGDGLASYLGSRTGMSVIAITSSFSMLREVLGASRVDLALVDVTQGIDLDEVHTVAGQWPSVALLALGFKADQKDVVHCRRAGFSGYVARDAALDSLQRAMEDAVTRRLHCPPRIAGALYRETTPTYADGAGDAMTQHECDVPWQLGNSQSNKAIAGELGLSISTIKHYMHSILDKLWVVQRAQAMRARVRDTPWTATRGSFETTAEKQVGANGVIAPGDPHARSSDCESHVIAE